MLKITESEFISMKRYIREHCGIYLEDSKGYLIESRLSDLVMETGCKSFQEFHLKARTETCGNLRDRIIDAMTTNETLWFRDESAWVYIREKAIPHILNKAHTKGRARIWSAAASTGQEAYSMLMLLHEEAMSRGTPSVLDKIEIIATDISTSALLLAKSGRYSSVAMGRGLPLDKKEKYFKQQGNIWLFDSALKTRVQFKKFNLQDSFIPLGIFDLILCRYVIIYFEDNFKKEIYKKLATAMPPDGTLLLGASESLRGFSDDFKITYYKNTVIHTLDS